jgi:hypothetical protein
LILLRNPASVTAVTLQGILGARACPGVDGYQQDWNRRMGRVIGHGGLKFSRDMTKSQLEGVASMEIVVPAV